MGIKLDDGRSIISMVLINTDTGEESQLFERTGSRCYFHEEIHFGNYIINLRIDWGDIQDSDPILDADLYQKSEGKKNRKIKNSIWHHTKKKYDPNTGLKTYNFSFNNLQLRLIAQMSVSIGVSMDAIIVKKFPSLKDG